MIFKTPSIIARCHKLKIYIGTLSYRIHSLFIGLTPLVSTSANSELTLFIEGNANKYIYNI